MNARIRKPVAKDFRQLLDELTDPSVPFSPANLYSFSDLDRKQIRMLESVWDRVPVERRRQLLEDLGELEEASFEVDFEAVSRMALDDEDSRVRAAAIGNLWEVETPNLIAPLIRFLTEDPSAEVRAAAASSLGHFVYLHELEEIPAPQGRRVEDALLAVVASADEPEMRRRALEALGFSSRPEVPPLIESAYRSGDERFQASALFAMGRAADRRWAEPVIAELRSTAPALRFEAARAAGELELKQAVSGLTDLLDDADDQVRDAAIWSLSQVGGPRARQALTGLLEQADEDEAELLMDAMDNLDFTDELNAFPLLEFDVEDDSDEDDEDER